MFEYRYHKHRELEYSSEALNRAFTLDFSVAALICLLLYALFWVTLSYVLQMDGKEAAGHFFGWAFYVPFVAALAYYLPSQWLAKREDNRREAEYERSLDQRRIGAPPCRLPAV